MWQQTALPHPPLPVSHGHGVCHLGDTHWQQANTQMDPPPIPPTHAHIHILTHIWTCTFTNTSSIPGFRHRSVQDETTTRGGTEEGGGGAVEMQISGTGFWNKSNRKLKHTLVQYLINQNYGSIISALHFDHGANQQQFVNMEMVAHIFLHKVGIDKLSFVMKTLVIDLLEFVSCNESRPEGVFLYVEKLWVNERFFHL